MIVKFRNRETGEYRDVELDGPEPRDLGKEVTQAGYPAWEMLRPPGTAPPYEDATYAELLDSEIAGENESYRDILQHEALILDAQGVAIEDNPHITLSPGELDAGLTPEGKLEQIRTHYARDVPTRDHILGTMDPTSEEDPPPDKGSKGLRARSSDDGDDNKGKAHAEAVASAAAGGGDKKDD